MKCRLLLMGLWCFSLPAVTRCLTVDGYLCVSDYWRNITCVLNITGSPASPSNTSYRLKFIEFWGGKVSCPLTVINHSYTCVCKVKDDQHCLAFLDKYDIELCDESGGCSSVGKSFVPHNNIQLTPPPELEVQQSSETVNITCKSRYEEHWYLQKDLHYELLLQTPQGSESKLLALSSPDKSISINGRTQLTLNAEYCIKARYKPGTEYIASWSEWSKATCWKNKAEETSSEQKDILVILVKTLGPVCVFVGVLLFVFYSPAARMKIKTLSHTPSPAPFFQPLFQQHKGNLQEWLSPQGTFVLTYEAEEILTTDVVSVVPKPIMKDPEENQVFSQSPSETQMVFIQCQSSYVGLPGMQKASPPITVVCPSDTSYTQLPSSVWGFNTTEVEVISPPPKDFLEMSCNDSGCSCEDLSQSPACSLPNSPVVDNPKPHYCSDYCILNKTAEGVIPVLLSKEISSKSQSDPAEG